MDDGVQFFLAMVFFIVLVVVANVIVHGRAYRLRRRVERFQAEWDANAPARAEAAKLEEAARKARELVADRKRMATFARNLRAINSVRANGSVRNRNNRVRKAIAKHWDFIAELQARPVRVRVQKIRIPGARRRRW